MTSAVRFKFLRSEFDLKNNKTLVRLLTVYVKQKTNHESRSGTKKKNMRNTSAVGFSLLLSESLQNE
jgi:hypothetical protein